MARRLEPGGALALFAVAVVASLFAVWLHLFFLFHAGGFWRDEVNVINLAGQHSLSAMSLDSFPVLMPALIAGWSALGLGQNDFELRILGMLIGLATPAALWWAAWKIRRAPPLLGLVLLALNTTVIMFGDSLRAYGVGSLTILLTAAAAGWFLKSPTWPRAAGLAVLAILSVQALYQNAVLIMAIGFGAWAVCARRKDWAAAVKVFVMAAASASSLLPYWSNIVYLPNAAAALRRGVQPEMVFIDVDTATGSPLEPYRWVWGFLALALIGCAGAALWHRRPAEPAEKLPPVRWPQIVVAAFVAFGFIWFAVAPRLRWPFLPLMMLVVAFLDSGLFWKRFVPRAAAKADPPTGTASGGDKAGDDLPLFAGVTLFTAIAAFGGFLWFAELSTEPWYFIPLMALAAVCYEIGLPLSGVHARAAVLGFAVTTLIGAVYFVPNDLNQRFTNVDLIAQRLMAQAALDDYIIVSPWYCGITFDRYYKGPTPWNTLPPLQDHTKHRYDLVREQMETPEALRLEFDKISATLHAGHRVWVVGAMDIPKPGAPVPSQPPPPPLKRSGWSDQPYNSAWAAQAAQFLGNHSRRFVQDYSTTGHSVNVDECLRLFLAEGWKDDPASPTNSIPAPASS